MVKRAPVYERFRFAVVAEYAQDNRGGIIGDTLSITTDGGVRILLKGKLVGAIKPNQWKQVILQDYGAPKS